LKSEKNALTKHGASLEPERIEQRAIAHDEELRGRVMLLDQGHGADEVRAAFFLDETPDEENDGIAGAGAERVGREEAEVDPNRERAQLRLGNAAFESLTANVVGDADEEAGATAQFGSSAEIDAPGRIAAKGLVGHGCVVAVERGHEGNIELLLDRERSGGVDGEVRVQQDGVTAFESTDEVRGDAGGEEEMAAEFVREGIVAGEKDGFAVVEAEAGGHEAEAGKAGRVAAQCMGLGGDKSFRGGQKLGAVNKNSGIHGTAWGKSGG
jgi:hypothetical protein